MPVYAHDNELGNIRRDYTDQASTLSVIQHLLHRPRSIPWALHALRKGARVRAGIPTAAPLGPAFTELPGTPVPVPTPGHSAGHCSFLVEGHVLVAGDALITAHPTSARTGPHLLAAPFTKNRGQACRSIETLANIDADILAPGQGPAWAGSVRNLIEAALES